MKIEIKPNLSQEQKEIITRLWNVEYPEHIKYENVAGFEAFLDGITEHKHFLLFDENENLKAWLVSFNREGERWFSIIVDSSEQKKGYGTRLLNEVKQHENELNGWVVPNDNFLKTNGEKYLSPIGFYKKNGFTILENIRYEKTPDFCFIKINWKNKMKYAAFLRGINVGGKNKLPMETLREVCAAIGFENVKTYINSGNIIFETSETDDKKLAEQIEKAIEKEFGLNIKTMVRSIEEIENLVKNNPFDGQFENDKNLHVFFLDEELSDEKRNLLLAQANENEMFSFLPRTIFCNLRISILDSVVGKGFIDRKLKVSNTARNWRTVNKVLEF